MHILSLHAPVVDAALCEPPDDAFIAHLLELDDEVDEQDDDEHEATDEVDEHEVETTDHEIDEHETNETSDEVEPELDRQQVETRILSSTCSSEELIAAGIVYAPIHDAIVVADVDADRARALYEEVLRAAGVRGVVR